MYVYLVMAMTADGKTARPDRSAPHFGAADRRRLEQLCATADALVMGAGTFRAQGATVAIRDPDLLAQRRAAGRPEQPLSVIVSRGGRLDTSLPFFTRQAVPRAVATPNDAADEARRVLSERAEVWACGEDSVDPRAVLERLRGEGHDRVALLGGAGLNADWFAAGVVNALELTLAPVLFGGAEAPTVIDGDGLPEPQALRLTDCRPVDGLLFLTYHVEPSAGGAA